MLVSSQHEAYDPRACRIQFNGSLHRVINMSFSTSKRISVFKKTNGFCAYCGVRFASFSEMCIDHIVPKIQLGSNAISNLMPCCRSCNSEKGTKHIEQYRLFKWFKLNVADIGIGGQQIEHLIKNYLLSVKYDGFKFFYEEA